jgi:DNA invertase Pin-like site-specific DNA recombinase
MNVAIYARVSTTDQNCAMQLRELRDYATRQGWIVYHEYTDCGVSGWNPSRPKLNALMKDAAAKRFDAVLCWKLDRFGRSLQQVIANVQTLTGFGVRFIATTQSIDSDQNSPMGRFLLHLFASLAELERGVILERVHAGIANAKAKGTRSGNPFGRPRATFNRDKALKLRAEGNSVRMIAGKLGVSPMTVQRCIKTHI